MAGNHYVAWNYWLQTRSHPPASASWALRLQTWTAMSFSSALVLKNSFTEYRILTQWDFFPSVLLVYPSILLLLTWFLTRRTWSLAVCFYRSGVALDPTKDCSFNSYFVKLVFNISWSEHCGRGLLLVWFGSCFILFFFLYCFCCCLTLTSVFSEMPGYVVWSLAFIWGNAHS